MPVAWGSSLAFHSEEYARGSRKQPHIKTSDLSRLGISGSDAKSAPMFIIGPMPSRVISPGRCRIVRRSQSTAV